VCVYVCVCLYTHIHTHTQSSWCRAKGVCAGRRAHAPRSSTRKSSCVKDAIKSCSSSSSSSSASSNIACSRFASCYPKGVLGGGQGGGERERQRGEGGGGSGRVVARVCPVAGTGRERRGERENTCAASSFATRPPHFLASSLPWGLFRGTTRETLGQVHTCCRRCKLSASY
jgi:hypothetical protein